MCGIIGSVSFKNTDSFYLNSIERASESIIHRGPDQKGFFKNENVSLGHRRLSIIDLDSGNQPIHYKNYTIIFNGELYNFKYFKEILSKNGISFQTNSDTEVFLKTFIYEKELLFKEADGMFAAAIWDNESKNITLIRDRMGEKPLYYFYNDKELIFSSELKALKEIGIPTNIDNTSLNYYLATSFIPAPYTIYKGVKKLEPGHFLTFSEKTTIKIESYFKLNKCISENEFNSINSLSDAKKELHDLMIESVKLRMISDVDLGAFLSGGIDSSIVVGLMSKLSSTPVNTFSIGFESKIHDESLAAKKVAQLNKTNHHSYILKFDDVFSELDKLILHFDEPFSDSSLIPTYVVSKLASEKVKVVLTGDGADELFAGYNKYRIGDYAKKYNKIPSFVRKKIIEPSFELLPKNQKFLELHRKFKRVSSVDFQNLFDLRFNMTSHHFDSSERDLLLINDRFVEIKGFFKNIYDELNCSELSKALYLDQKTVLEGDMLVKVDRMSMLNSLETRVPFLDPKIVKFSYKLNDNLKIHNKQKKYILKETFRDYLPNDILKLPKKGFTVPIEEWLNNQLKSELDFYTSQEVINDQGIFNFDYISRLKKFHFTGKENSKNKLWSIFSFQKWYFNNHIK